MRTRHVSGSTKEYFLNKLGGATGLIFSDCLQSSGTLATAINKMIERLNSKPGDIAQQFMAETMLQGEGQTPREFYLRYISNGLASTGNRTVQEKLKDFCRRLLPKYQSIIFAFGVPQDFDQLLMLLQIIKPEQQILAAPPPQKAFFLNNNAGYAKTRRGTATNVQGDVARVP